MSIPHRNAARAVLAAVLCGLAACATPQAAGPREADLKAVLEAIKQRETAGQTGTLRGIGLLNLPPAPPVALDNGEVSLIPSTPQLETALAAFNRRWRDGRRQPVAASELQSAFAVLDRHVRSVQGLGERALIRFAKTDDKGQFTFEAVPAGRWILVATMESQASAILWAIPGDVQPGETSQVLAGNNNILLEGRVANSRPSPAP